MEIFQNIWSEIVLFNISGQYYSFVLRQFSMYIYIAQTGHSSKTSLVRSLRPKEFASHVNIILRPWEFLCIRDAECRGNKITASVWNFGVRRDGCVSGLKPLSSDFFSTPILCEPHYYGRPLESVCNEKSWLYCVKCQVLDNKCGFQS